MKINKEELDKLSMADFIKRKKEIEAHNAKLSGLMVKLVDTIDLKSITHSECASSTLAQTTK